MNKRLNIALSIAALVVALSVPLSAQSFQLTAKIPFDFAVGAKSMPAGEYQVTRDSSPSLLLLRGSEHGGGAIILANPGFVRAGGDPAADTVLVFRHYGDRYFLSEVRNGFAGIAYMVPMSKAEREMSKTASAQRYEVLATLARR
ncbi:MAG: hypothetical protein ACE141_04200 [Bryobacteraceae bacterium]